MATGNLTAARLRESLHYDPATGVFTWISARKGIQVGDVAGCFSSKGYRCIVVDGVKYRAARLAWLYVTREWPPAQVDHRSRARADDRWDNLRLANPSENQQNVKRRKDNTSGFAGVSRNGTGWKAGITLNGVRHHLGTYKTPEEALAARSHAQDVMHPFHSS